LFFEEIFLNDGWSKIDVFGANYGGENTGPFAQAATFAGYEKDFLEILSIKYLISNGFFNFFFLPDISRIFFVFSTFLENFLENFLAKCTNFGK